MKTQAMQVNQTQARQTRITVSDGENKLKRVTMFGALILSVLAASAVQAQMLAPPYWTAYQRQGAATAAKSAADMASSVSLGQAKFAGQARTAAVASGAAADELATGDACLQQYFLDSSGADVHKGNGNLGFNEGAKSLAAGQWLDAIMFFDYAIGAYAQAQAKYCSAGTFASMARDDYLAVTN